ncbi:Fabp5p [Sparganum proliferum]
MEAFYGSWKLTNSEGFDAILQRLDVGLAARTAANTLHPTVTIEKSGDEYSITTASTFKTSKVTFKLGEEFEEKTQDGRIVKTTIVLDGDALKATQVGDKVTTLIRTVEGDCMKMTESYLEKDLATCSHVYLRCDRVRRPLEPPYDGPFRVISRGTKNFRIQLRTREEVMSVDRLKTAVPDTPPAEPCGPLPSPPPPRSSMPPSHIFPLPPCPRPPTATTRSSTSNATRTIPSASLRAAFGLAVGYCGGSRLRVLHLCHAVLLSASRSCRYAVGTRKAGH